MTSVDVLTILIAVAIGTPTGIFLAHALRWLLETLDDLIYDIRWKIRNRRK